MRGAATKTRRRNISSHRGTLKIINEFQGRTKGRVEIREGGYDRFHLDCDFPNDHVGRMIGRILDYVQESLINNHKLTPKIKRKFFFPIKKSCHGILCWVQLFYQVITV